MTRSVAVNETTVSLHHVRPGRLLLVLCSLFFLMRFSTPHHPFPPHASRGFGPPNGPQTSTAFGSYRRAVDQKTTRKWTGMRPDDNFGAPKTQGRARSGGHVVYAAQDGGYHCSCCYGKHQEAKSRAKKEAQKPDFNGRKMAKVRHLREVWGEEEEWERCGGLWRTLGGTIKKGQRIDYLGNRFQLLRVLDRVTSGATATLPSRSRMVPCART